MWRMGQVFSVHAGLLWAWPLLINAGEVTAPVRGHLVHGQGHSVHDPGTRPAVRVSVAILPLWQNSAPGMPRPFLHWQNYIFCRAELAELHILRDGILSSSARFCRLPSSTIKEGGGGRFWRSDPLG